jgi:hypothetical protein
MRLEFVPILLIGASMALIIVSCILIGHATEYIIEIRAFSDEWRRHFERLGAQTKE